MRTTDAHDCDRHAATRCGDVFSSPPRSRSCCTPAKCCRPPIQAGGLPAKYGEHESVYFRDTILYSIGELGIHRLGCSLALNAGIWSASCILILGPF